jgi:hypothetical protein
VLCNGASFQFNGNISEKLISQNNWGYKVAAAAEVDLPGILLAGLFVEGDVSGGNGTATLDIVSGCGYLPFGGEPSSFVAYFVENFTLNLNVGQGFASADVSAAAGYIAHAVLKLEEFSSSGSLVNSLSLQYRETDPIFNPNNVGVTYTLTNASAKTDPKFITFSGAPVDDDIDLDINITFMASSIAGVVDAGFDFTLVPGSVESLMSINYPSYASTGNYLNLTFVVATGSASLSSSGQTVYDASKKVYCSFSKNAYVDGKQVSVSISAFREVDLSILANTNLAAQVKQAYNGQADFRLVSVVFPAGATSLTYDPSIGAGVSATDSSSGSSDSCIVAPLLSLMLLLAAFLMF